MALRDHSLDDKITAAAMKEFSGKGYAGASLRKIAEKAGVTVGAIQTRYPSKDELFANLVKPLLDDIEATFRGVKADYYSGAEKDLLSQLKSSMQHESDAILHLIFAHYEQAVLLFYRSAGSALEHYFDKVVQSKIDESAAFFRAAAAPASTKRCWGAHFDAVRELPPYRRRLSRRAARRAVHAVAVTYHFGGWAALFASKKWIQGNAQHEV